MSKIFRVFYPAYVKIQVLAFLKSTGVLPSVPPGHENYCSAVHCRAREVFLQVAGARSHQHLGWPRRRRRCYPRRPALRFCCGNSPKAWKTNKKWPKTWRYLKHTPQNWPGGVGASDFVGDFFGHLYGVWHVYCCMVWCFFLWCAGPQDWQKSGWHGQQ